MIDHDRLQAVLGKPALAWLIERLRGRLEGGRPLAGTVRLHRPTAEQRRAVDLLLGRSPSRGQSVGVSLERLESKLRHARLGADLRQAVEALLGPVADLRAEGQHRERRWRALLEDVALRDPRPEIRSWWRGARSQTLLRRYSAGDQAYARELADRAVRVIALLPARGIPLQEAAARATGDSHALDRGRPLATLTWHAAACLAGMDPGPGAEQWREVWEAVGVLKNDLSASVLVLGLPAIGSGLSDQVLRLHAAAGEPCRLTTGQLLRHPPDLADDGLVVHLCENPAVLSTAAQRLGNAAKPLICIEGRPRIAAHRLLVQLVDAGARLLYHGDFDWHGLAIADRLMARYPIEPWRFTAADYRAAAGCIPLDGTPVPSPWDPDLAKSMRRRGVVVHEEQLLDTLLADLNRPRSASSSRP